MTVKRLPSGTQDKLFRRAEGVYQLEHQISDMLKERGFQRIETPTIEFAELFYDKPEASLYRFFDNQGRLLVLRPDMTLPVGRVVSTTQVKLPLKLSYSGKVFRYHDEMKGLQNEMTQIGIEIMGFSSLKSEYEAIFSAYTVLNELEMPNFFIEIGHAKIIETVMSELPLDDVGKNQLEKALIDRNISELKELVENYPSDIGGFVTELPTLFGDIVSVITRAKELLPKNHDMIIYLDELLILSELFDRNVQKRLKIDLGMVRSMDYYSGVMFAGYGEGIPDSFLNGGRYDDLLERFGVENAYSVGWAMNLEGIFDLLYKHKEKSFVSRKMIHIDDLNQLKKVQELENDLELSLFHTIEETRQFAKKWGYEEVWYLHDNQLSKEVL